VFGLGYAAGSMGGGQIAEPFGMSAAFGVAGGLAVLSLVALLGLRWKAGPVESLPRPLTR
ncbi:MAG: hypothetical protein WA086_07430, partial [Ideonella sp.]